MSAAITVREPVFITLADGTRLTARLWLPANSTPAPAILEYIPYRLRDGTRGRDEPMHGYFAGQGYASIRVDMRGTGESDGLLDDEYLKLEQDDCLEVIAWIAAQDWCDGSVGMFGKSWGGFNCLQVAARRPPALKAIISVYSTEDRFGDDIHYMGGNLLNDNLWWGAIMLAYQARPLDPRIAGDNWRKLWLDRLAHMPLWPALWLRHQRRDAYWRHGSVREDFSAITVPVLAIGGWADAYTNAVPRLLEGLTVPSRGIIGPWAHIYPHDGLPLPAMGFLGEAVRWWDHWLKGEDRGVMEDPVLRAYIEDSRSPSTTLPHAPGRWVGEASWPSREIKSVTCGLTGSGELGLGLGGSGSVTVRSPLHTGTMAGEWMGCGTEGEMPGDQRLDDGLSQCFTSSPLDAALDILGFPIIELDLASDKPLGQIAVRLNDVAPDGTSLRVSYGVLNLAHRDGSAEPAPMVPGKTVRIRLPLKVCGHRFAAGHRIRVAISTAYWPILWPARDAATLTISLNDSQLILPVRTAASDGDILFPPVEQAAPAPTTLLRAGELTRRVAFDHVTGVATYETIGKGGLFGEGVRRFDEIDVSLAHDLHRRYTIHADDPLSARSEIIQSYDMVVAGREFRTETVTLLTADATHFRLEASMKVLESEALIFEKNWDEKIERDNL